MELIDNLYVSKNFTLLDLCVSDYAIRNGLLNVPGSVEIANLRVLAENVLEPLSQKIGPLLLDSVFRAVPINIAIGGAPDSQHCKGQAADLKKPGWSAATLFMAINSILTDYDQLILEFNSWCHVSFSATENRKECLVAEKVNGKTIYKPINLIQHTSLS